MFSKFLVQAALGLTAVGTLTPMAAVAQNYGGWNGQGYSGERYYTEQGDGYRPSYSDRSDYYARQRWIEHRRWEEARRRRWQHDRWEQRDNRGDWDSDHQRWGQGYGDE